MRLTGKTKVGKFIDLTGKKFGRLLVIKRGETINKRTNWVCECECGNIVEINSYNLLKGRTKSCGCYRKEKLSKDKLVDITGLKFGQLTVISFVGSRYHNGLSNGTLWLCECSCGNQIIVPKMNLIKGLTQSCGHKGTRIKDKIGQRFGLLTVEKLDHIDERDKHAYWLCKCDCGNHTVVDSGSLSSGNTKSCGCLHSLGEHLVQKELELYGLSFIRDACFDSLLSEKGYPLKFDFLIYNKDIMVLIEYQGIQHYIDTDYGRYQRETSDLLKKEWCKKNNIPLYEIKYDEEINSKLQWILKTTKLIPCQELTKVS